MENNIFLQDMKRLQLSDYMNFEAEGRGNLGEEIPVAVYRLLEYSLREQLLEELGKKQQVEIFRKAGYRAGQFFAESRLDLTLPFPAFLASVQHQLEQLKIGILRVEKLDEKTGSIVLTVSEDADCSGLPLLGETVCNYDEGFLSGLLSAYTGKKYAAVEVDCWATGDRVCRFRAEVSEQ